MGTKTTAEQKQQIVDLWYTDLSTAKIGELIGRSETCVRKTGRAMGLPPRSNHHYPELTINDLQHQILLSGRMGDGHFSSRSHGETYRYSESHAQDEKEYVQWKFEQLKNLCDMSTPYQERNQSGQPKWKFTTKSLPQLQPYGSQDKLSIVSQWDERALILFLLDDGHYYVPKNVFTIASVQNAGEVNQAICEKFNQYGIRGVHTIIPRRPYIYIPVTESYKLYEIAQSFLPMDLDICLKKFPPNSFIR